MRAVAALCATIITKHDAATGSAAPVSRQLTSGSPRCGKPPATGPMTAMPCAGKIPHRAGRNRARHGDQRTGYLRRKPCDDENARHDHHRERQQLADVPGPGSRKISTSCLTVLRE